jgi:hypothetical protein
MKKYLSLILLLAAIGTAQSGHPDDEPSVETRSESVAKVKVFPNPATNVVNVLGLKNTPKADISVLDIYGNTVLKYQWAIRRNALNIPIATLDPGAYILHIHSDGQRIRTKFYKQ